jgi:hypothetical protein
MTTLYCCRYCDHKTFSYAESCGHAVEHVELATRPFQYVEETKY